jgi:hypothetical protein
MGSSFIRSASHDKEGEVIQERKRIGRSQFRRTTYFSILLRSISKL